MSAVTYLEAVRRALAEELDRDDDVVLWGQDLTKNVFGASRGLEDRFGSARIRDLPMSEAACVGAATGAAMAGMRPILDLTISSFIYCAMDQLVNHVAKNRYMSGGQLRLPVTFRATMFYAGGTAAQHADRPYGLLAGIPGLRVVVPSTPRRMKGLLKAAVRSDDPVFVFEDSLLWSTREEIPAGDEVLELGRADVVRAGDDVTVIAIGAMVPRALAAAAALEADGIDVEVVDPQTLSPIDWPTLEASTRKTGRVLVVDGALPICSVGSEIAATLGERAFDALRRPIGRLASANVHSPFSRALETGMYPDAMSIESRIRALITNENHAHAG